MLILLPPSETKRIGGEGSLSMESLYSHEQLGRARTEVRAALEALSAGDRDAAAKALKLGVKNRDELERNLRLGESGTLPAIERYTGVLYDALDVGGLAPQARTWVDSHVLVQSALFGTVSAADRIPAYRMSAGSRLPALESTVKRVWNAAHSDLRLAAGGVVLDLRSKDYAALAPLPSGTGWEVHVAQRGADGAVRALNHFNKAAKGDLVRRLAAAQASLESMADLVEWADGAGLELSVDASTGSVTLLTELGASQRTA